MEALRLCARPVGMRAGAYRLLAAVVARLGQARAHHGYLFANARATRINHLVQDSWLHRVR
jgi:transposase